MNRRQKSHCAVENQYDFNFNYNFLFFEVQQVAFGKIDIIISQFKSYLNFWDSVMIALNF